MSAPRHPSLRTLKTTVAAALLLLAASSQGATIEIQSRDAPGVGFNDPTPVAPVGGNTGRTLGEQRMNVYRHVAAIWGRALDSKVRITVNAGWEALACNATGAVLGSASPHNMWYDFPGAPAAQTWYPQALANKLSGVNLPDYFGQPDDGTGYGNVDITTQFNVNLGAQGCLTGTSFYLGLDGNPPGSQIDFAPVLLHELGHGLGFTLLSTDADSGDRMFGLPSIWEYFMYDNAAGMRWLDMDWVGRWYSARRPGQVVWTGQNTVAAVPQVLGFARLATLQISGSGAGAAAGTQPVGEAAFGPLLVAQPLVGSVARFADQASGAALACTPLSAANAALVAGKVALVDRGSCAFTDKVRNVQDAGAKAVLIADNVVQAVGSLGGSDPLVTIPAVMISKAQGDAIKSALQSRVRGRRAPEVMASLSAIVTSQYAGADLANRPRLYTPAAFAPGSSVSHWDVSLTPSVLMEPFITRGLSDSVGPPRDLTLPLLKDIGW